MHDKGAVIGGASAGMALLSEFIYDPDGVLGAESDQVVTDYCHDSINFSAGIVNIPVLRHSINDSHFYERNRMGRLLVFMTHQANNIIGIAASEATSLFVTSDGLGIVDGSYEVYITKETSSTDRLQVSCGQAVIYNFVSRIRLTSGDTYNFNTGNHTGDATEISIDGRTTDYYTPVDPYLP